METLSLRSDGVRFCGADAARSKRPPAEGERVRCRCEGGASVGGPRRIVDEGKRADGDAALAVALAPSRLGEGPTEGGAGIPIAVSQTQT